MDAGAAGDYDDDRDDGGLRGWRLEMVMSSMVLVMPMIW